MKSIKNMMIASTFFLLVFGIFIFDKHVANKDNSCTEIEQVANQIIQDNLAQIIFESEINYNESYIDNFR